MEDNHDVEINPFGGGGARMARTTVQNAKFEVEKFDGTNNFGMWQCEVRDVLAQQDLDMTLEDMPEDMDEAEWIRLNRVACSSIRLCLAKAQKYSVMRETSAKMLWQKLEDKYMTKSIENRLHLKKKLYRFQFKGTKMIQHLDAFNKLIADLLNLDEEIKDEDKALLLLNSLPDAYDHLATTLLYGKDTIKFDEVSNALMNYEVRHKDKYDSTSSTLEALVVRGRSLERKRFGGRKKSGSRGTSKDKKRLGRDECAFCHNKGHWKNDCPKLRNKGASSSANVVLAENEPDYALCVSPINDKDKWIMDCACTEHMTPRKDWFTTLDTNVSGDVITCDDYGLERK